MRHPTTEQHLTSRLWDSLISSTPSWRIYLFYSDILFYYQTIISLYIFWVYVAWWSTAKVNYTILYSIITIQLIFNLQHANLWFMEQGIWEFIRWRQAHQAVGFKMIWSLVFLKSLHWQSVIESSSLKLRVNLRGWSRSQLDVSWSLFWTLCPLSPRFPWVISHVEVAPLSWKHEYIT